MKRKILLSAGILLIGGGLFVGGFFLGESQVICKTCAPEAVDFSLFWEAWNKLQENYVDATKLDTQKLIYGAISGMVDSLEDPYTVFMEPTDAKKFLEDAKGRFEGVGMEVGIRNGVLQVIAPIKGTPAEKAGLKSGDQIIKIDDQLTSDLSIDEAVNRIRGTKGTEVKLSIFREGWETTKDFTIVRETIEPPSVEWELKDGIAYVKLYQFSEQADYDFDKTANEIISSEADSIILDLRDNPGGYLEVAQDISGWFLKRGQIVTTEDRGENFTPKEYLATGNSRLMKYPLVVLINGGSASGSEILAGALRDNLGTKLIGEISFGKGSVQQLESLSDGSTVKVTVAKWLTPKGASISEVGLEPDVKVELTDEDYEAKKDPQLDKAIEIINSMR